MATLAIALAGSAIGGATITGTFLGLTGAQIGYAAGSLIASQVFGPKGQNTEDPGVQDRTVPTADEGVDIPRLWGTGRMPVQVLWSAELKEVKTTEKAGGKGGPSASHTSKRYYWTCALGCGHAPGAKLLQILVNGKPWYDARPGQTAVQNPGLQFTFYDGNQTEPDPTLVSYLGEGNVPAYMDECLLVIRDLPLGGSGQQPVIEVVLTTSGTESASSREIDIGANSPSASGMLDAEGDWLTYIFGDSAGRLNIYSGELEPLELPDAISTVRSRTAVLRMVTLQGTFRRVVLGAVIGGSPGLACIDPTQPGALLYSVNNSLLGVGDSAYLDVRTDGGWVYLSSATHCGRSRADDWFLASQAAGSDPYWATWPAPPGWDLTLGGILIGGRYHVLRIKHSATGDRGLGVLDWDTGDWATRNVTSADGVGTMHHGPVIDDAGRIWLTTVTDGDVVLFSFDLGLTPLRSVVLSGTFPATLVTHKRGTIYDRARNRLLVPMVQNTGAATGTYVGVYYIDSGVKHVVVAADQNYTSEFPAYIPETGEMAICDGSEGLLLTKVDSIAPARIPVTDVLIDTAAEAGLDASHLDLSAVSTAVTTRGVVRYRATQARAIWEQVTNAYGLIAAPSGYKLRVVPRGQAVVATLDAAWLGVGGESAEPVEILPQAVELPAVVELSYISFDRGLQPGLARPAWRTGVGRDTRTVRMNLVLDDAEAADLVDQMQNRALTESTTCSCSATRRDSALEAGDVIEVPVRGSLERVLITQCDRGANGQIRLTMSRDDPEDLTTNNLSGGTAYTDLQVAAYGHPAAMVLDIPLLRDIDQDQPSPYIAAHTYATGWPGATLFYSVDGADFGYVQELPGEATVGQVANIPATVDFEDWDDTNTLQIALFDAGHTLESVSDAALLDGQNAAAWGAPGRWEIVGIGNPTLTGTKTYDATHLLRGRRGTEWAMGLHQPGDALVMLNDTALRRLGMQLADIGQMRWLKLPRPGDALVGTDAVTLTGSAEPLKPYAPVGLSLTESTNWTLNATRRTRRGGALGGPNGLTDGIGGALSEDSQAWEVDVWVDGTLVNTYTGIASLPWTYLAADISTDGADGGGHVALDLYQISAAVGRGHAARALTDTLHQRHIADLLAAGPINLWPLDEFAGDTARDLAGASPATWQAGATWAQPGLLAGGLCVVTNGFRGLPAGWSAPASGVITVVLRFATANAFSTDESLIYWFGYGGLVWDNTGPFGFRSGSADVWGIDATAGNALRDSNPHCVIAELHSSDFAANRLWIDGVEQTLSEQIAGTTDTAFTDMLALGDNYGPSDYNGDLSVVALFDRPPTAPEVATWSSPT